jgi:hypothetical protein
MKALCALAIVPLLFMTVALSESAGASSTVVVNGTINGQVLSKSSQSNPVRIYPLRPAKIVLTVRNNSSHPVHVATVRLAGEVIGLTFFAFNNSVAFSVPPHRTVTNRYSIPLVGLSGQATGLVNGSLSVLNPSQETLASQSLVVDVRGSLMSVYGVFGLAVALLTVLAFALVLLELARHRLPANRFLRGLYFLVPGLGLGLVLVFTLSAARVFVPSASHWVPLVIGSGIVFFVVGFLTPDPRIDEDEDEDALRQSFSNQDGFVRPVGGGPPAPEHAQPATAPPWMPDADGSSQPHTAETPAVRSMASATDGTSSRMSEPKAESPMRAPATVTDPGRQSSMPGAGGAGRSASDTST